MVELVTVFYRQADDGWHIFTSKDVPTLLVASRDRVKAYNDVPTVLQKMFRLTQGVEWTFTPELSAEEFFDRLDGHEKRVVLRKAA